MRTSLTSSSKRSLTLQHSQGGTGSRKSESQIQGDVQARLKGLPGRLLDLGGGAQSSIKSEQFEGFTQDATAIAMQGDRDCRERLFKQMFDKLGSADAPAVPKSGKPHVVIMTFTLDQRITRNANSILITAHFTIHNDGDATAEECYVKFWPLSTPDTTGDFLVPRYLGWVETSS